MNSGTRVETLWPHRRSKSTLAAWLLTHGDDDDDGGADDGHQLCTLTVRNGVVVSVVNDTAVCVVCISLRTYR